MIDTMIDYVEIKEGHEVREQWGGRVEDAVRAAAAELDAVDIGGETSRWAYRARETGDWYVLNVLDMVAAGAAILAGARDWYSIWCTSHGYRADDDALARIEVAR